EDGIRDIHVTGVQTCAFRSEAVQLAPLLEQRRLGGVQVLRLALVEDAPAEGDDAPAPIVDREDDAVAEAVVAPALVVVDDESGEIGRASCREGEESRAEEGR